ncbi:MAG: efflux RND transporter periplasmic adaptor subunit [Verrucomicrobiota bacterium]
MQTKPSVYPTQETSGSAVTKWAIAIAAVVALFCGLGAFKYFQIRAAMAGHMSFSMPPEAITTVVVKEQQWPGTLTAVGTIKPVNGLTLRADLAGNVESIGFESGAKMRKGDLLVQQDITEEQAQLRAAQARQQLAEANLRRFKGLLDKRVSSQSDYDATAAEYLQAQAKCQEISAVIEKKTIRAPFDGMAGIRMVNDGEYLQPGQQIVPFQSMSPIYANFTLPQQNLADVHIGSVVKVSPSGVGGKVFEGKVTAVNSVVDEATRNFLVQATLENPEGFLRPGMYVGVEVVLPGAKPVLAVPSTSISFAPYGDSVFVVKEMDDEKTKKKFTGVDQQFIKLGETRGDQVEIVSGIQASDEIASSGIFKLRPKASVKVNNQVQPPADLAPQTEDR